MTKRQYKGSTKKGRLTGAIFAEAAKRGIDADYLRETIAPAVIGKRMSKAGDWDLFRLLEHIKGKDFRPSTGKDYQWSIEGLKDEICDIARDRFGEDWEKRLNALCKRMGALHWKWLTLAHAKAVKATLIRLEREGPPPERCEV